MPCISINRCGWGNSRTAIGERGFFASQVLGEFVFTLHKLGKNVQFLQKNVNYRATDKTPIQRAVARSFADVPSIVSRSAPPDGTG